MKLTIQYHSDSRGEVDAAMFMGDAEPFDCVGRFHMTSLQWEGFKQAIVLGVENHYCRMLGSVDLVKRPLDGLFVEKPQ